jgi:hypothetical protein
MGDENLDPIEREYRDAIKAGAGMMAGTPQQKRLAAAKKAYDQFRAEQATGREQTKGMIKGYLGEPGRGPFVGANPYEGGWKSLIEQLQGQANGTGPSLAGAQYNRAAQDQQAAIGSLARGAARPGATRAAMMQQARVGQGLASGSAEAVLQEQNAARGQLGAALSGAGQASFQRDAANQQGWLTLLASQLGIEGAELAQLQAEANSPTGFERMMGYIKTAAEAYATYQTGGAYAAAKVAADQAKKK